MNARIWHSMHIIWTLTEMGTYWVNKLAVEMDLALSNLTFQKQAGKLWTNQDPKNLNYQVDYILIKRKWRKTLKNVASTFFSSFDSFGLDHREVVAKLQLSLWSNVKTHEPTVRYDWEMFRHSPKLQQKYTIKIRNRYEALSTNQDDATQTYKTFVQANKEAMEEMVPKVVRRRKNRIKEDPRVV
jgi:hypothetical protein